MNYLKSVSISGYRGFDNEQVLNLALPDSEKEGSGLTIVTGANNSGKSTIIEALRARAGYQLPTFSEGTRNKNSDFVRFKYSFVNRTELIESINPGSSQVRSEFLERDHIFRVVQSRRGFHPFFGRNEGSEKDYVHNYSKLPSRRESELSLFEMRLFDIEKDPGEFNNLLEEILGFSPQWTIDQTSEGNYYIRLKNGKLSHSSDGAGEGIISVLSIVDALSCSEPGGLVAIDEPELSLHPAIVRRLVQTIVKLSKDRQIVICTHSPYFIDPSAIANGAALVRVVSEIDGSKIYQLDAKGRESIKKIHNPDKPNAKAPHTFGLDARELFFMDDNIILTEGQDDVMLYPVVASQLPIKRMPGNLFGWGVGGAQNVQHFCHILTDLGYKKVAVLLDNDQEDQIAPLQDKFSSFLFFTIPAKDVRDKDRVSAREPVVGLLEKGRTLREEYKIAMQDILISIKDKFSS